MSRRLLRATLEATLPRPSDAYPAWASLDWPGIWATFAERAPVHLRAGLPLAARGIDLLARRRHGRGLLALDVSAREALLAEAATLPATAPLVDILRLIAGLIYFHDPRSQRAARGSAS